MDAFLKRCYGHVTLGGSRRDDQGHAAKKYVNWLAWKCFGISPEELDKVAFDFWSVGLWCVFLWGEGGRTDWQTRRPMKLTDGRAIKITWRTDNYGLIRLEEMMDWQWRTWQMTGCQHFVKCPPLRFILKRKSKLMTMWLSSKTKCFILPPNDEPQNGNVRYAP